MKENHQKTKRSRANPAYTPEGRENQLIALAYDKVEERIQNNQASAQELVHFLRLGTEKAKLEKEKLEIDKKLAEAKIKSLGSDEELKDITKKALTAFSSYKSSSDD